jgi:hypothetical protein
MATDLTPFILEVVKTHLNPPDLHARTAALPGGELFITLFTSHPPTPPKPCANSPARWKASSTNWN